MRGRCGVFDVSHMGEIETQRPQARRCCSGCSPTTSRRSRRGRRAVQLLCREDGGVLDDLFTYRLDARPLPDRHQRRQPRARPRLVPAHAGDSRGGAGADASRELRDARRAGPASRARSSQALADAPLPPRMHAAAAPLGGRRGAGLRHRLHRRGRRRAAAARPADAPTLWDALVRRGAVPAGLGARDTLRLEACFQLYGNDLMRRARADRGRAGLVLQGARPASSAPRRSRARRAAGPPRSWSRSRSRARHRRARATRSRAAAR